MPSRALVDQEPVAIPGFDLLERIGQGGMGEVYRARQRETGKIVAVKFLALQPGDDPARQRARFEREAALMARLDHPHITSILNGCGMDAATKARIFEPFFSTKLSGRGVGLSAVYGIIRGHGGAVWASNGTTSGTTITILLPVA
jgi:serine/threonine protein kinase